MPFAFNNLGRGAEARELLALRRFAVLPVRAMPPC